MRWKYHRRCCLSPGLAELPTIEINVPHSYHIRNPGTNIFIHDVGPQYTDETRNGGNTTRMGRDILAPWRLGVVYMRTATARVDHTINLRVHGRRDNKKPHPLLILVN